jgi:hypothetical protein
VARIGRQPASTTDESDAGARVRLELGRVDLDRIRRQHPRRRLHDVDRRRLGSGRKRGNGRRQVRADGEQQGDQRGDHGVILS